MRAFGKSVFEMRGKCTLKLFKAVFLHAGCRWQQVRLEACFHFELYTVQCRTGEGTEGGRRGKGHTDCTVCHAGLWAVAADMRSPLKR